IPTMWVRTWKLKDGIRIPKSRLVIRGDLEKDKSSITQLALPNVGVRNLALLYALKYEFKCILADVSSAFLHSEIDKPRYVSINKVVYQLKKGAYGLNNAPKLFVDHLKAICEEEKFQTLTPGMYKNG